MTGGAATALWLYVVFFAPLSAAEQAPPPGDTLVRAEVKQESVASVAGAMENEYVFPDVGRKIAEHLRSQQRQGAYAAPMTFLQFADALTHDLQAINADRHLYVRYQTDAPDGVPGVMVTRRVRPGAGGSAGPTSEIGPRIQKEFMGEDGLKTMIKERFGDPKVLQAMLKHPDVTLVESGPRARISLTKKTKDKDGETSETESFTFMNVDGKWKMTM